MTSHTHFASSAEHDFRSVASSVTSSTRGGTPQHGQQLVVWFVTMQSSSFVQPPASRGGRAGDGLEASVSSGPASGSVTRASLAGGGVHAMVTAYRTPMMRRGVYEELCIGDSGSMKYGKWLVLPMLVLGCGGQIASGEADATASSVPDADTDAASKDAGAPGDVSVEASKLCSASKVVIGYSNPNDPKLGCKIEVRWTCDTVPYRAAGGCDGQSGGSGICEIGGSTPTPFPIAPATCRCDDPDALAASLRSVCGKN